MQGELNAERHQKLAENSKTWIDLHKSSASRGRGEGNSLDK